MKRKMQCPRAKVGTCDRYPCVHRKSHVQNETCLFHPAHTFGCSPCKPVKKPAKGE